MDSLSFADVSRHDHDIIEVCPHEHIEISSTDIDELLSLISENQSSTLLLINQCREHSYSFGAILGIRALKNVKAHAMLCTNTSGSLIARVILGEKKRCEFPFETFLNKDDAIKWLSSYR